jgi:hypothetical protein
MTTFIYTPKGYINLANIEIARHKKGTSHEIVVDERVVDSDHAGFGNTITQMIPVQGNWECLMPCDGESASESVWREPVIAWGLSVLGDTVPITPTRTDWASEEFALQREGDPRVFEFDAIYPNIGDWLETRRKRKAA